MAQSQSVYVKELLEAPAAPAVPWLHERWTWEGDETPLPGKWASIQAAGGVDAGLTADWLRQHVLSSPMFDAASTFFLTHRSNAVGTVTAWPDERAPLEAIGCLRFLAAAPGPEEGACLACLIAMAEGRLWAQGRTLVHMSAPSDSPVAKALAAAGYEARDGAPDLPGVAATPNELSTDVASTLQAKLASLADQ